MGLRGSAAGEVSLPIPQVVSHLVASLKSTVGSFLDDHCLQMAAALSYYTVFSLPSLLVLLILLGSLFRQSGNFEARLAEEIGSLMGPQAAGQIRTVIENVTLPGAGSWVSWSLGVTALLFGATGAFVQLQRALNTAWEVEPGPGQSLVKGFLSKRLLSLGMILTVGFFLLVSLVLSAVVSAAGDAISRLGPSWASSAILQSMELGTSLFLFTILSAAIFVVLPDAEVSWRDVWIGAFFTSLLFVVGKFLIGFYLGRQNPGSAFGAAGSLIMVLAWVYYSATIFLFGTEFTQSWAAVKGRHIRPEEGAIRAPRGRYLAPDRPSGGRRPSL